MTQASNPRVLATRLLSRIASQGESASGVLGAPELEQHPDKSLIKAMVLGTCRYYFLLEANLDALVSKPFRNKDRDIKLLLLLGFYQLKFLRQPDHAVVSESVKACKGLKRTWAKNLVNATLRNFIRAGYAKDSEHENLTDAQKHAFPAWLEQKLAGHYAELAESIMQASNQRAPLTLRINQRRITRDGYAVKLEESSLASSHGVSDAALHLADPVNVTTLPGFASGELSVQDGAAQLAAEILQPQQGQRVLDACAAPGGKSAHLLEYSDNKITLVSIEKDPERRSRFADNMTRLGFAHELVQADAGDLDAWWDGNPFDQVLLDAPCSALGIIRRHPDIKLLRRADDIAPLVDTQRYLLRQLWKVVKPGGSLLYATCSILPEENEHQVSNFLAEHDNASIMELPVTLPQLSYRATIGTQILPGDNQMDGFFYALLQKSFESA